MTGIDGATHIVIPDTQAKPGVPTAHLDWIGRYIVDHFAGHPAVRIIHLGDHWDMPSLSSYDRGKKAMEGRRVKADLEAGNEALDILDAPLAAYNARMRRNKEKQWLPQKHMLNGNHEDRIARAVEDDAQLDGFLSLDVVNDKARANGWTVHRFLDPLFLDGIGYAHFWANPMSGRPYGGHVATRLKTIGHSFTMGHQQTFDYAVRYVRGLSGEIQSQHGLVVGACLTPDHKVLTADLRYVPLGDVKPGDKLVSFDEHVADSAGRSRRYRTGTVRAVKIEPAEVFRVTLDNGKAFKVTADHQWLVRVGGQTSMKEGGTYQWRRTDALRKGTLVPQMLDEWETLDTYEAGYLAGIYDGEGCYYQRTTSTGTIGQLSLAQKPGVVLNRSIAALGNIAGAEALTHTNARGVSSVRLRGGLPKVARMLGSVRPSRLLAKFEPEHLGTMTSNRAGKVVSIEPLGQSDIVRIDVDAKTMIVEGYAHHNCYLHDEDYKGYQGNAHWRGIVVCHEVRDGSYSLMQVTLDYLCRRYEGVSLSDFMSGLHMLERAA